MMDEMRELAAAVTPKRRSSLGVRAQRPGRVELCVIFLLSACGDDPPSFSNDDLDASLSPVSYECGAAPAAGDAGGDGGTLGGAACDEGFHCAEGQCVRDFCGDGIQNGAEQCDDGNQRAGDGCTPSCRATPPTCGDGTLQADSGEECDDANWFNFDGCSNDCTVNFCGNSREDGYEECDDGNAINDDACSNECLEKRCRNGRLDPGEECDDGNLVDDDGTWLYEENYSQLHRDTCSNACTVVICGNGILEGSEQCDDGNSNHFDACGNGCAGLGGCGNGKIEGAEKCDGHKAQERCENCAGYVEDTACKECREQNCRAVLPELFDPPKDLVGLCFNNAEDPEFAKDCTALVDCMRRSGLGYGPIGAIESFCGSAPLATCSKVPDGEPGGGDGPCTKEWYRAARTTNFALISGSIADPEVPCGIANMMLQVCDSPAEDGVCAHVCGPQQAQAD